MHTEKEKNNTVTRNDITESTTTNRIIMIMNQNYSRVQKSEVLVSFSRYQRHGKYFLLTDPLFSRFFNPVHRLVVFFFLYFVQLLLVPVVYPVPLVLPIFPPLESFSFILCFYSSIGSLYHPVYPS